MASDKAKEFLKDKRTYVVAELGSCHLGDYETLRKLTDGCILAGADAVKVQLFPNRMPYAKHNIFLNEPDYRAWLGDYHTQIDIGVSCFGGRQPIKQDLNKLKFIKMARSLATTSEEIRTALALIKDFPDMLLVGSFDYNGMFTKAREAYDIALYCHAINGQTQYPVSENLNWTDIIFNTQADGVSDHTLNIFAVDRKENNVVWLEKHVMLNGQDRRACGDAHFAFNMDEFKNYVDGAKGQDQDQKYRVVMETTP